MVSKKNKERATNFAKSVEGLSYENAEKEIASELAGLNEVYKITTVRTILTEYRKALPKYKHLFIISDSEQSKIQRAYTQKIAKQANDQKQIAGHEVLIEKAKNLLSSSRVVEVATALAFLTGRRISEIFCTAKFAATKDRSIVHFVGQLKKRDSATPYKVYTLVDYKEISKALKFVRAQAGTLTTSEANRKYIKACNQVVYKHYSPFLGNCSTHDLRKAYATIIAHKHRPKTITLNAFLSANLGHEPTDLSTANVYQKYFI
jgi:hypothetical protein